MTDKEKLENIKECLVMNMRLKIEDVNWLIGQTEHAQELEEDLRTRDNMAQIMDSALYREDKLMSVLHSKNSYRKQRDRLEREVDALKRQSKHREEAIKKAIHETYEGYDTLWIVETLQKALGELK